MRLNDSLNSTLSSGVIHPKNLAKERDKGRIQDTIPIPKFKKKEFKALEKAKQIESKIKGAELAKWINQIGSHQLS